MLIRIRQAFRLRSLAARFITAMAVAADFHRAFPAWIIKISLSNAYRYIILYIDLFVKNYLVDLLFSLMRGFAS